MRIVIALGGNALGIDPLVQRQNVEIVSSYLAKVINEGNEVVITHGNGPQVGLINMAFEEGHKANSNVYLMPFAECGAMSQAYIGYHLTEAINNKLENKKIVSLLTNVLVDKCDPAFLNPTKPIGPFYTKEEASHLPFPVKEDSGRGYRRVIASPKPVKIMEEAQIKCLLSSGCAVICCGGGGIPVISDGGVTKGIDAVIDKDYASSTLAKNIDADMLLIVTSISNAKINFGKENEINIENINTSKLKEYLEKGEFKVGSMKPKIKACLNFVEKDKIAVITNIENIKEAINLKKGTIIRK